MFEDTKVDTCCLCGSSTDLSGEHKVKASILRGQFGNQSMYIGSHQGEEANGTLKFAQGPKSKVFHFDCKICRECNSKRSQPADLEFDRFLERLKNRLSEGADLRGIFEERRYQRGTEEYLNVFRYFAKLLCCHMATGGGPRPIAVSKFAIGDIDRNHIKLGISFDHFYSQMSKEEPSFQYAAHGGLVVMCNKKLSKVRTFYSTLTVGPIQFCYFLDLRWFGSLSLKVQCPEYFEWCIAKGREAMENPIRESDLRHLGLL